MPYPSSWSNKDLRMYRHIKASSGSKSIAAATVNKFVGGKRGKKKRAKRRRG